MDFGLASMDIRTAFLQGNLLDRRLHEATGTPEDGWIFVEIVEAVVWIG